MNSFTSCFHKLIISTEVIARFYSMNEMHIWLFLFFICFRLSSWLCWFTVYRYFSLDWVTLDREVQTRYCETNCHDETWLSTILNEPLTKLIRRAYWMNTHGSSIFFGISDDLHFSHLSLSSGYVPFQRAWFISYFSVSISISLFFLSTFASSLLHIVCSS